MIDVAQPQLRPNVLFGLQRSFDLTPKVEMTTNSNAPANLRFARSSAVVLLVLTLLAESSPGVTARLNGNESVLRFDAEPTESQTDQQSIPLYVDSNYTAGMRFGWTRRPAGTFRRAELLRSRNATTIDGVYGREVTFRADVKQGDWVVIVKLEAEYTAAKTLRLFLQGQQQELHWQSFGTSAEPPKSRQRLYRIYQNSVQVAADGLVLHLIGVEQDVRLLGISLFRLTEQTSPSFQSLHSRLAAVGDYQNQTLAADLANELSSAPDAHSAYAAELLDMLIEAQRLFEMRGWSWARSETGLGMFDRLHQAVFLTDGILAGDQPAEAPLSERARYLRGRILYWLHREGAVASVGERGRRDLQELHRLHPDDSTLAMYVGEKIDKSDPCDRKQTAPDAPAWSIAQHEILCRMRQIAHWWVKERQADNGELGGKWGDDVEMLRWWAPLALMGDQTTIEGWKKLADGVWHSNEVADGYAAKVNDVEHAAELIADTAPLMAALSDEPQYLDRLSKTAEHFGRTWTADTSHGHLHFRSAWFNANQVDITEPKGRDVEYNTRAVQPMRYRAWLQPEPHLVRQLSRWSSAWVDAAMRTGKGKPAGLIPASIRFSDEAINGDEPNWYQPRMYWKYFDWQHHAGSLMMDQLLFTFTLTGDEQLLQPMLRALELVRAEQANLDLSKPNVLEAGSAAWAARQLVGSATFWSVVAQWRFATDDSRYDDLILSYGTPYARYRLTGNEQHLLRGLEQILEDVRYNVPMKTTEALHTDRVYVSQSELVKAMLTGDGVRNNLSPYYVVTWENTNEDFTALVRETARDRVEVEVFSHGSTSCHVILRLWNLRRGSYRVEVCEMVESRNANQSEDFRLAVQNKGQRVKLEIAPRTLTRVRIAQK